MSASAFEPAISAIEWLHTYAIVSTATGIIVSVDYVNYYKHNARNE
jgi:hypothetical protein